MARDPRILITGASGQVGRALVRLLPVARGLSRTELDVTDAAAVDDAIAGSTLVVHLAAMTDVDGCERDPQRAIEVNVEGTRNVARAATRSGAKVLYVSTDYVFDGRKQGEYLETDEPSPINEYGRSKLEGEEAVLDASAENLVIRTSWIIGDGKNFVAAILRKAEGGASIPVVDDQRGRPTFARPFAAAMAQVTRLDVKGILHITGDGPPCSWADLAEESLRTADLPGTIERVTTEAYGASLHAPIAPRPKNSLLSLDLAKELGVPLEAWPESLQEHLRERPHG